MKLYEYFNFCSKALKENPDWRKGQTYFNVLVKVRPDLSEKIRGQSIDPFFSDSKVPAFNEWLSENW